MIECIEVLSQTNLFAGIAPNKIAELLGCIQARFVNYSKDDLIIEEGNEICEFGIMLSGHGRAVKWDASNRLIIIALLEKGSEIGAMLATGSNHKSPVSVQAQDDVSILLIPFGRLLARCKNACPQHERLLRNYIQSVAEKGLMLHERINCLLQPSVRGKITAYLSRISHEQQNKTVTIPLNRNAMAEYLNVERSALSRELSHMKRDGIIDYYMNSFKILWR